ncbi:D-amino-acid dehydrogenase [Amycolatopsis lexingtonensis]|uniref:D-amino-acid dehydrogenase n=1 Tax=Amycolatopsis lexingtonensis TaxID=218822 RepID=A0ABR9I2T3_9PSEU|nr:FAD-dependent oxidoreductase [Amycolatopsis lexingtonensis]MBE1497518.1 D-amino-acid dehydrogenase [Amycolatopsis lexingtonensis]
MRVLVIGSGIGGAATAWHLARRGVEVVVADAARPGTATEAGAGIVSPWTSKWEDALYPLASAAGRYYREFTAELEGSSFEVVGGMIVSADEAELTEARERLDKRSADTQEIGEVRRLDPAQARELFPALAPGLGAVHLTGAGRVDGHELRRAFLRDAERQGAKFVEGEVAFRADGTVAGEEGPLEADSVVVAAGAWSRDLLAPLGIDLPVTPHRGQISHFDLPGTDTAAWPVVLPRTSHYLLAFGGGRVVAGATREAESGFDYRVTAAGQREVLDHALAVAPGLADATLAETRVGFRPGTPDGLPILGLLRPGLAVSTGFGAGGLTNAPFAGKLVAALAVGEDPGFDLTPFAPDRF